MQWGPLSRYTWEVEHCSRWGEHCSQGDGTYKAECRQDHEEVTIFCKSQPPGFLGFFFFLQMMMTVCWSSLDWYLRDTAQAELGALHKGWKSRGSLTWRGQWPPEGQENIRKCHLQPSDLSEPVSQFSASGQKGERIILNFLSAPRLIEGKCVILWYMLRGRHPDPGSLWESNWLSHESSKRRCRVSDH